MVVLPDRVCRWLFTVGFPLRQRLKGHLGLKRGGAFVVIRAGDDLLVVRHGYRRGLDLPGGGRRRGESSREAAAREINEEIGLTVAPEALRRLGAVRRGFRAHHERDDVFELRVAALPAVIVDHRELVWAGPLGEAAARWRDLQIPVRWYLRRYAPDLAPRRC